MADNVAIDGRPRFAQQRNCIYGFCREHTPGGGAPLFFNSAADAINLKAQFEAGTVHLAKEALVAALAPNSKTEYHCRPVAAQGSCCKDTNWKHHHTVIALIEKIWYEDPRGYTTRRHTEEIIKGWCIFSHDRLGCRRHTSNPWRPPVPLNGPVGLGIGK